MHGVELVCYADQLAVVVTATNKDELICRKSVAVRNKPVDETE